MLFNTISVGVAAVLLAVSANALPQPAQGTADTCTVPATTLKANAKLPNPFQMISGKLITKKDEWTCRRAEILDQFYKYELGVKPPKPESVTATYSGGTLTITCTEKGKSISFKVTIKGNTGSTPVPAIIGYGGGSIPVPAGVATINFNNDDMGAQQNSGSRGKGKFFDLYGTSGGQGATTAWAWGVSRIIDALEITKEANIDPTRIGVTGCSRNGKGAFMAGALDERVALTIPQESGSGGSACWRLSDYSFKTIKVQTADEIIGENCWFGTQFDQFAKNKNVNQMPIDHHMLQGLVAPRGLYVIENTDMEWLGAMSTYGCSKAASLIYKALGASDNYGYSQIGGHSHCQFPSGQQAELTAFIDRFLKGGSGKPGVFRTDGGSKSSGAFKDADWIDWDVPALA